MASHSPNEPHAVAGKVLASERLPVVDQGAAVVTVQGDLVNAPRGVEERHPVNFGAVVGPFLFQEAALGAANHPGMVVAPGSKVDRFIVDGDPERRHVMDTLNGVGPETVHADI